MPGIVGRIVQGFDVGEAGEEDQHGAQRAAANGKQNTL